MRTKIAAILLVILSTLYACSGEPDETSGKGAPHTPPPVLKVGGVPLDAAFFEQDSFNIPYWVQNGIKDRTLVRLSSFDGMTPVDDATVAKLKSLADAGRTDELRAAGDAASGNKLYDASSTVYVANRLGVVKEVVWVVPLFLSVTKEDLDGFKKFLSEHYPKIKDEVSAIRLEGNTGTGTLYGMPVRIIGLQDLKAPSGPVILDVDASYFVQLYSSEKDTPSLKFIAGMFALLRRAGISSDAVSIATSGEDGRAPLKFRAFAVYLKELLKDPGMIDTKTPPALWTERAAAWKAEQSDPELAVPIYKNIASKFPDDAPSRYDTAELYFRLGELEACAAELNTAVKLDPGYHIAFEQIRDSLTASGEVDVAQQFYSRKPAL